MDVDRPADGAGAHRVFVVVEAHQAVLRHRARQRGSCRPATIGDEDWPFRLKYLPHGLIRSFRVRVRLGVGNILVGQPGVQLIVGFDPKARREKTLPDDTDLILDPRLRGGTRDNPTICRIALMLQCSIIIRPRRSICPSIEAGHLARQIEGEFR